MVNNPNHPTSSKQKPINPGKGASDRPQGPQTFPNYGKAGIPLAKRPRTQSSTSSVTLSLSEVAMEYKSDQQTNVEPADWAAWPFPQVHAWTSKGAVKLLPPRDPQGSKPAILRTGYPRGETLVALHELNANFENQNTAMGRIRKELTQRKSSNIQMDSGSVVIVDKSLTLYGNVAPLEKYRALPCLTAKRLKAPYSAYTLMQNFYLVATIYHDGYASINPL
jgi:hypothetical protein